MKNEAAQPIVEVRNLKEYFNINMGMFRTKPLKAVDNVSFAIQPGETLGLVIVSRTHPGLVKRLFELEVPEIASGLVEIKSIAREAGSRTKIAVFASQDGIDPVGACVGTRGARVGAVVNELHGEKMDIIVWSEDPAKFVASALSPADVKSVTVLPGSTKACRVIVPDDQLSLAIGKEGQNARLAARLTGYKIDIKPASQEHELELEDAAAAAEAQEAPAEDAGLQA